MLSDYRKVALMGAWILAIGIVGYISGATSFAAWVVLAVLSLAPPVVMARLSSAPARSMSESIREVLR
jgi:hypothetical protein